MKSLFIIAIVVLFAAMKTHAACSSCGSGVSVGVAADEVGPQFTISLGSESYGQSAGDLTFGGSAFTTAMLTPAIVQCDNTNDADIVVVTTNVISVADSTTLIGLQTEILTNTVVTTNNYGTGQIYVVTNTMYTQQAVMATNIILDFVTNTVIRQVYAPQALADILPPPTTNGFSINFYYPSQLGSRNADGTYQLTGAPFGSWLVTNPSPTSASEFQVSEFDSTGSTLKQWTYTYTANTATWALETLAGVQKNISTTNVDSITWQVINSWLSPSGQTIQQSLNAYQVQSWGAGPGVVLVSNVVGSGVTAKVTTYTYWDPGQFNAGTIPCPETINYSDGYQQFFAGYNTNGLPTDVYTPFQDDLYGHETTYEYDPTSVAPGSGDDGSQNAQVVARRTIDYVENAAVSCRYTLFPAVGTRLDIQCVNPAAAWNSSGNLITTNLFYTNGPNQWRLAESIRPDGTATTYNYLRNGICETNITATGVADSTGSFIVDGTSNQTIVNFNGYLVSSTSWDIKTSLVINQDVYSNFDSYGRPQAVTHLDGTTETTTYACCGINNTVDRDGVNTLYLYDADRRQYGAAIYYSATGNPIENASVFDSANRTVESYRIGTDGSTAVLSGSTYDTAARLVQQTNALNGVTSYVESNDPVTGGLVRTITYPNGGTQIDAYYCDRSLKSVTGTGLHGKGYAYGATTDDLGNSGTFTTETNLDVNGNATGEYTTTFTDAAGRKTEVKYADDNYTRSYYNILGQLTNSVDADGVSTMYAYNNKGELSYTILDMNQNGIIDWSGPDRITQTTNDVVTYNGVTVYRTRTLGWLDGQSVGTLISQSDASVDGTTAWQTQYRDVSTPVTTEVKTVQGITKTITTTMPDNSSSVSTYSYGRLASTTRYDSGNNQVTSTSYGYDPHGRQNTSTDARNGTTTLVFNNADLVTTNTTPNPGSESPEVTATLYDTMLRPYYVIQPDSTTVNTKYLLTGEIGSQSGSRTYPVGYSYDYAGRMQTMTNWGDFASFTGARITTWMYDGQRGWLTGKTYDGGTAGPSYTYTAAGRLYTRTWARSITTTYGYDNAGDLSSVNYSDAITPDVSCTYDRLGRKDTMSWNGITDTLTNNLANQLTSESFAGGNLNGLSITNVYDSYLRRVTCTALNGSSSILVDNFGYDAESRLSSVTDQNNKSANYSYLANSLLMSQIEFKQSSATRMTTTKQYDYLNRLTKISSAPGASYALPVTFKYNYNPANQRNQNTLADGSYWIYGYDSLGQVTNAAKFFSNGTPVPGQQFGYTFDNVGNRTQTMSGGDTNGASLRLANYSANHLNQITSRDVPPYVDVLGASILTNTVTVNGQAAYRNQEYFRQQVPANNTNSALWTNILVSGGQSVTGNVFVAQEPETFKYDADGNLTNDGRWQYVWDAENRLTQMLVNTNVGPQYRLLFAYDPNGRRIQKSVTTNGVSYTAYNFLYDGWNLLATLSSSLSPVNSFMWGNDLSGSVQGAGGVGGLLEVSFYGITTTNCFPAFDGNGNLVALVNATDGTIVANYEYGPFGETVRSTGPMAKVNPIRYSTKYDDDESDLAYYGYRYYNPNMGNWSSRDPIGDLGFETSTLIPLLSISQIIQGIKTISDYKNLWDISPDIISGLTIRNQYEELNQGDLQRGMCDQVYLFSKNSPIGMIDLFGLQSGIPKVVQTVGKVKIRPCPTCTLKCFSLDFQKDDSGWPYNEESCDLPKDPGGIIVTTGEHSSAVILLPGGQTLKLHELTTLPLCSHVHSPPTGAGTGIRG